MPAAACAAGGIRYHGARFDQRTNVAGRIRLAIDRLRAGRHQKAHTWCDAASGDHTRRDREIIQIAVGAGADERLVDALARHVANRHGVADDAVG